MSQNTVTPLTERALAFAAWAHALENQRRKVINTPYIEHPVAVAGILRNMGAAENQIAAAYLHDTVEDTPVTIEDIRQHFGTEIGELVDGMTSRKPPDKPKAEYLKEVMADRSRMSDECLDIKLADRLHNVLGLGDPLFDSHEFKPKYAAETREVISHVISTRSGLTARHHELAGRIIEAVDGM